MGRGSGERDSGDDHRDDLSLGGETRVTRTPVHFDDVDFNSSPPKAGAQRWSPKGQEDLTDGAMGRSFLRSPIDGLNMTKGFGTVSTRDRGASVSSFDSMWSERSHQVQHTDFGAGLKNSFGDDEDAPPGMFDLPSQRGSAQPSPDQAAPKAEDLTVPGGPSVFSGLFTSAHENRTWAWDQPPGSVGLAPWQLGQAGAAVSSQAHR